MTMRRGEDKNDDDSKMKVMIMTVLMDNVDSSDDDGGIGNNLEWSVDDD